MPRVARIVIPGLPHHITQRGNYRQKIFFRSEDYRLYLNLLADYARQLRYCLMPNHVHLILVPRNEVALGRLFRWLHGDYA
ncbi:MAG: transposase [Bryobacteraceae bacterium]|nr:transposase [Bryobacteraceae bacterium]